MKVSGVMSRDVVSATPETTYKEAVDLMLGHDVGSLPVVDDLGRVVGIVSEADLVPKAGYSAARRRPLLALLDLVDGDDAAWRKARARTVADVMTARPVTVHPDDDVAFAARTLVRGKRKRAPVVDEAGGVAGRVCDGVVTLTGTVDSADDRRVVARAVRHVPGVVDVVDEINVPAPVTVG